MEPNLKSVLLAAIAIAATAAVFALIVFGG